MDETMENFTSTKNNRYFKRRPLFFAHLLLYLIISSLLVIINLVFTPERIWSKWVIFIWGLGVLLHELYISVFHKDQL
ncbi:hypothetical protein FGF1_25720 [Flavobacteriaceae bacterium GF1]